MWFRGECKAQKKWLINDKLEYCINIHNELNRNYQIISKLVIVCNRNNIPLIIENPYSTQHYLQRYWCIKPKVIDENRRERGDYMEKPTQYWFINREPSNNLVFDAIAINEKRVSNSLASGKTSPMRSMISKDYANRFIREFII